MSKKDKIHWLKAWRKGLGLTQKQAAALLGLKHRMIQNYEGGSHEIPRYVRLSCYAIDQRVVDFGEEGTVTVKNLAKRADVLRDDQKESKSQKTKKASKKN